MAFSICSLFTTILLAATAPSTRAQSCASSTTSSAETFTNVLPANTKILGQYGHSPAVYPSPNTTGIGWTAALEKAKTFLAELTLEEKAWLTTGRPGPCVGNTLPIERLNYTGLCLQDGPLAIRVADYASVFSAGVSAAASFDKDLMYERGRAMGREFKGKGSHVYLGPVAGPIGRSAYAGRNWEGFSSDPYLCGIAMEETITGMQDSGVQACPKHFITNEQETQRNPNFNDNGDVIQEAVSSNLDDRTMHELYLWPFANAIRAKAASVMCSYNRINGSYGCANSKTLNGLLKGELGFQGYVMSDWGATHSGVAGIQAGQDMDMPGGIGLYGMDWAAGSFFGGNLTAAVNNGSLPVDRLNDMVLRVMTPYFWLGQDQDFPSVDESGADLNTFSPRSSWLDNWNFTGTKNRDVRGDHAKLIRKHGAASAVLLKNVNSTLPLKKPKSLAVFGNDAGEPTNGFYYTDPYEYGVLPVGGGSGTGRFTYMSSPLQALQARGGQDGTFVQYWLNNTLISTSAMPDLWNPDTPEACVVFLKTWATEGADRAHLSVDYDGDAVVESVADCCSNTIVVTHSSGINLLPWADNPNVTAIIAAHYPGQEAGNAIVDVLYGDVNPSARLPYTIAFNEPDYNAPPITAVESNDTNAWQSYLDEGLAVDYRYFDQEGIAVRYPFGYGLSYTTFSAADLKAEAVSSNTLDARPRAQAVHSGGNPSLWEVVYNVTATVKNTGDIDGYAMPQLYVSLADATNIPTGTPIRQLKGFSKVGLKAGESATVGFELMRRDVSFWDTETQEWVIPQGKIGFSLGWNSRDLVLNETTTPISA